MSAHRVLLTDHPWYGVDIEQAILADAGLELIEAPPGADRETLSQLGADVEAIMTCWAQVSRELLSPPRVRVVSRLGVALDNIDLEAASDLGVLVTNVPDYCVEEVSDHVLALTLGWARGIRFFDSDVRAGRWQPGALTPRRVRDLTVGVWGFGRIGQRVGEKFSAMGCAVLIDDRHLDRASRFPAMSPTNLVAEVDVLTVHMPLNAPNAGIIDADVFGRMRRDALFVNVSRGGLVDVDALADALDAGHLGAAALDVLPDEPHLPERLRGRDDVIITPHVAFSSSASVDELRRRASRDVVSALRGETPEHAISPRARRRSGG